MPPVGGAQQSQVAVGGTEALLKRGRRRLGISQHLRVKKQVGKRRVRSSRCVFCCDSGTRQGLTGTIATRQGRQHNTHMDTCNCVYDFVRYVQKFQVKEKDK